MANPSPQMTRYLDGDMTEQEAAEFEEYLIDQGTEEELAWIEADTLAWQMSEPCSEQLKTLMRDLCIRELP